MAWVDPELDDGAADALRLLELDVPFAVPEPVDVALPELELLAELELLVPVLDVAVEPGRVTASAPAVTSPAAPTETVAARRVARPRRRAATAGRVSSLRLFIEGSSG